MLLHLTSPKQSQSASTSHPFQVTAFPGLPHTSHSILLPLSIFQSPSSVLRFSVSGLHASAQCSIPFATCPTPPYLTLTHSLPLPISPSQFTPTRPMLLAPCHAPCPMLPAPCPLRYSPGVNDATIPRNCVTQKVLSVLIFVV